jgi:ATP-dependent Lon protease
MIFNEDLNNIKSIFLFNRSKDKEYIFNSFRNALIVTMKWIEMSSLFISFFYSDTFFKVIQEKINDPKQAPCVPFVLLSIFMTDMQMFEEIHCSDNNFQYTFISNLQKYPRCTIDKLTELFPSLLSREIIKTLAIESFDSMINLLFQENQFLDKLSIDDREEDKDQFFGEVKNSIFSKFNQRKCLIEKYVTIKWKKIIDYMQQQDHMKHYLIQNFEKSIKVKEKIPVLLY